MASPRRRTLLLLIASGYSYYGAYQMGLVYARSWIDHLGAFGKLRAETFGVVGRPARGRDLDHTHVVERGLLGVEVRVLPVGCEHSVTDGIGEACLGHVDGVADRCLAAAVGVNLAAIGNGDIVDPLLGLPVESTQPLMTWTRSRLAPSGSRSARIMKPGAFPAGAFFRSPPMGTPRA